MKGTVILLLALGALGACAPGQHQARAPASPLTDDARVAQSVRQQLATERGLDARQLQVRAHQGIVTLVGQVRTSADATRAAEAAQLARGVRGVISHVHVRNAEPSDPALSSNVLAALRQHAEHDIDGLQVSVRAGNVTLKGLVRDFPRKQAAERVAWSVYGVAGVSNEIRVDPAVERGDDAIAREVRARLDADGYRESAVAVHANNRIVTLSGEVSGIFDRQRVLQRAAVPGVVEVRDALTVQEEREQLARQYAAVRSAAEMRAAVLDSFRLDPRVPERAVRVNVRSGVAELTGSVSTLGQKIAAGQDAQNAVGVWLVQNRLTLIGEPSADERLRQELQARLIGHPYVDAEDVEVDVDRGRVVLTGEVIGSFESRIAERAVRLAPGVVSVQNRLRARELPDRWRDDAELRQEVDAALRHDALVDSSKVTVSVENGVVTVAGEVENWEVYNAVLERVFSTLPYGVINQLQRRKTPPPLGPK